MKPSNDKIGNMILAMCMCIGFVGFVLVIASAIKESWILFGVGMVVITSTASTFAYVATD